jgi:hypothetical protein
MGPYYVAEQHASVRRLVRVRQHRSLLLLQGRRPREHYGRRSWWVNGRSVGKMIDNKKDKIK